MLNFTSKGYIEASVTKGACIGGGVCDLASTLCKYDLRKDYLFVGHWCDK